MEVETNPYLRMQDLDRVVSDAKYGVSAAKNALRERNPELANRLLGRIVLPGHEREQADRTRRILAAVDDHQRRRKRHQNRRFWQI